MILVHRLSLNTLLNDSITLKLLATFCTNTVHSLSELIELNLIYYEPIPTSVKYMCRIVASLSLRHIIFTLKNATLVGEYMSEYKTV